MSYKIKLDIFEGPLDLLLYLVKKEHLNIYDIPIAQVTGQYLAYLELMRLLDLHIAGEFLVMAATLMQIKSRMLIPGEEVVNEDQETDPREELVQRLLEYQRFKEIASELRQRELKAKEQFKRQAGPVASLSDVSTGQVYFEASIFDLINAFTKALKEEVKPSETCYTPSGQTPPVSIAMLIPLSLLVVVVCYAAARLICNIFWQGIGESDGAISFNEGRFIALIMLLINFLIVSGFISRYTLFAALSKASSSPLSRLRL